MIKVDEMKLKLSTKFMKGLLAKIISKSIKKKYGYKVNIHIDEIDLDMFNGDTNLHVKADIKFDGDEFKKLMNTLIED